MQNNINLENIDYSKINDNLLFLFQTKLLKPEAMVYMTLPYMRLKGSQTVIMYVLITQGTFTMGNLARVVGISDKSIAHPVKMLQKWGYIVTYRDQIDKRRNKIKITPKGKAAWDEYNNVLNDTIRKSIAKNLTKDEHEEMINIMYRLTNLLTKL